MSLYVNGKRPFKIAVCFSACYFRFVCLCVHLIIQKKKCNKKEMKSETRQRALQLNCSFDINEKYRSSNSPRRIISKCQAITTHFNIFFVFTRFVCSARPFCVCNWLKWKWKYIFHFIFQLYHLIDSIMIPLQIMWAFSCFS